MKPSKKASYLLFISSLTIVGTIGAFRRYLPLSSALLAFFRGILGAGSLAVFLTVRNKGKWQKIPLKTCLALALNGAFLGFNWILLFEAYTYTTVAKATLCYYLQPTLLLLLAPLVFKEKLTVKKLLCAGAALGGMVLVSDVLSVGGTTSHDFTGILFGLGAAVLYTVVVILNKKIGDVPVYEKTIIQLLSAAVVLIPYLLLVEDFSTIAWSTQTVLLLLVVGIIHTGVVYAMYFGSMIGLQAQTISMLSYIDPVVALLISVLVLREPMSISSIGGAALIIGSALISEYEPKSRHHSSQ